jgi:hypothetical protein
MEKKKRKRNIRSLLFRRCATSTLVTVFDGPRLGALPVRVGPPTGFSAPVVFRDETYEWVARLVWRRASRPGMVTSTIDAGDRVRALVERMLSSVGTAVTARQRRVRTWVRRVVGAYLDGGNGVGKIPPGRWSRRVLGGRKVVPNARVLPCESRSKTTCSRGALLGLGVGLRVSRYGVLNGLGRIVPSGSGVVGVHRWSHRWVSGITGVDQAGVGLIERT